MKNTLFLFTLLTLTQISFAGDADAPVAGYQHMNPKNFLSIKCRPSADAPFITQATILIRTDRNQASNDINSAHRAVHIEGTPDTHQVVMEKAGRTLVCTLAQATLDRIKAFVFPQE